MKRILYVFLVMLQLALLAGCHHRSETPAKGVLYQRYAARQDLKVAQLGGFKLCDSVRVDVVML